MFYSHSVVNTIIKYHISEQVQLILVNQKHTVQHMNKYCIIVRLYYYMLILWIKFRFDVYNDNKINWTDFFEPVLLLNY